MYNLLRRVNGGLQAILSCVSSYLVEQGKQLVMEDEGGKTDAITFVQVSTTGYYWQVSNI